MIYTEYLFALWYFNLFLYVVLSINLFLIIFNFKTQEFKTINLLKILSKNSFYKTSFIVTLLSMAGLPPFLGFLGKIIFFLIFTYNIKAIFIIIIIIINSVVAYFYLKNLRFLVSNVAKVKDKTSYIYGFDKFSLHFLIICLNSLNVFGIFFFETIINWFIFICSFIYLE